MKKMILILLFNMATMPASADWTTLFESEVSSVPNYSDLISRYYRGNVRITGYREAVRAPGAANLSAGLPRTLDFNITLPDTSIRRFSCPATNLVNEATLRIEAGCNSSSHPDVKLASLSVEDEKDENSIPYFNARAEASRSNEDVLNLVPAVLGKKEVKGVHCKSTNQDGVVIPLLEMKNGRYFRFVPGEAPKMSSIVLHAGPVRAKGNSRPLVAIEYNSAGEPNFLQDYSDQTPKVVKDPETGVSYKQIMPATASNTEEFVALEAALQIKQAEPMIRDFIKQVWTAPKYWHSLGHVLNSCCEEQEKESKNCQPFLEKTPGSEFQSYPAPAASS